MQHNVASSKASAGQLAILVDIVPECNSSSFQDTAIIASADFSISDQVVHSHLGPEGRKWLHSLAPLTRAD
jgi:hypothetical protein